MRAPVLQLAFLFGIAPVVFGSTDISGKWGVRAQTVSGPAATVGCLVEISQSDSALSITGSCTLIGAVTLAGPFDAAAGTFTASGHAESFCSSLTIEGSVAPDGASFSGTFDCAGPFPASGTFFGSHCGNGIVDPGEQCDDGNVFDGDCCSSSCRPENPGGWCPDDGNICTDDVCDGAGNCVHPPKSGLCDDGNECTVGDTCADGICAPGGPAPAGTPCGAAIDLCGTSRCDGLGACVRDPAPDGVACNDGDACTTGDTCRGGTCVGGPTTSCGPCRVCEPQRGCIPVRSAGCPAPRVRRPRKLRIDCHDGTIENQPVDPLCDVDHAADGTCTFAPRCPLCVFAGCLLPCFDEPRFTFTIKAGEHLVVKTRFRRPRAIVISCLPSLPRTTAP